MFLLMLLLIAYPIGAQLPSEVVLDSVYSGQNSIHSIAFKPTTDIEIENVRTGCGCTGVEFPTGVLKAGEEYHLKVDVNTADIAGSFKSHVAVKIAGEDSLWGLNLQVQAVPPFPAEVDFGEIDFTTLPLEHHLSLAQIVDQPLAIDSIAVQGEGVVAYPTDEGTGLLLRTDEALTWGSRIDGLVEVHLAGNDRTLRQTVHVEGKVLDQFQVDPSALSFGMGKPHRRQVKTVAVRVAPDAARVPVRVQSKCPAPTFAFDWHWETDRRLVVEVRNESDFPIGQTDCDIIVHIGDNPIAIPIFALTR